MNNIEELNIEYLKINARSLANGVAAISSKWAGETILALIAQLEAAQLDATRWRALLSSPAIRILGHAGLQDDKPIDGHYCHFGMEIWSHHEPYYDNKKAGELITRYADNMIAAGFTVKEDATPIVIVPAPAGVIMRPQSEKPLERCAAGRDGECHHKDCPQLRDNEPMATGRHCPIDNWDDE
ncbi:hypothetical protein [Yersinia sp. 22-579]|uniref:hypothetical protein n=1 Tax=Yersinia sp. 22-579 TaxID=3057580 RepID=UPI00263B7110|nr:hypothetical protein [Yersinia sp. 22-579]